jgi:hypothetical protein
LQFIKEQIKRKYDIKITEEELNKYKNLKLDKFKVNLTFFFFKKYFGSFDNYHLSKLQFIELLLIFKKILIIKKLNLLAEIMTSELIIEKRKITINNKDLLNKLRNTDYFNLTYREYSFLLSKLLSGKNELDPIMKLISSFYFNKWKGIEDNIDNKKEIILELLKFLTDD